MRVVVYGAGGHGKVVADIVFAAGNSIAGFVADGVAVGTQVQGRPVLGGFDWLCEHRAEFDGVAMGIGDNEARARVMQRVEDERLTAVHAVHPRATVAPSAAIHPGAVVMAGAVINADAVIERGAIINTGAVVEHDCHIGAFAHISPNAAIAGTVTVGALTHIGIGAAVVNNTSIGTRTIIGAGAVVLKPIGDDVIAFGVPARVQRKR